MELYFLRHGEVNSHEEDFMRSLTNNGQKQVNTIAMKWRDQGIHFDKIIVSPYIRTKETAEIIGNVLNCPLVVNDEWMEMNTSSSKDREFLQTNDGFRLPLFNNLFEYEDIKGESYWQLHSRSMVALEKVLQLKSGKYLVVAHGGILNATMRVITGAQPLVKGNGLYFQFGYLGYLRTEYNYKENMWIIKEFYMGNLP